MEGINNAVCQLCLQQTASNIFNESFNIIIKTFFPCKDLNRTENPAICRLCLSSLQSGYSFMRTANENNSKILDATIENDEEVCQTCLNPVANPRVYLYEHNENVVPFSVIHKMLRYCLIYLDLGYRQTPIMCDICWEILKMSYRFLVRCSQIESKIQMYCKGKNITSLSSKDLIRIKECSADISSTFHDNPCPDISRNMERNHNTLNNTIADDIFSEIKIEMEEQYIGRRIKIENDMRDRNESSEVVPIHENPIMPINFVHIKTEVNDISDSSNVEQSDEIGEMVSNDAYHEESCSTVISDCDLKRRLYVKMERLNLKEIVKCRSKKEYPKSQFQCPLCPFSFRKRYGYNRHLTTHMTLKECAKKNMLFRCDECNYVSKCKYGLSQHTRRIHTKSTFVHTKLNLSSSQSGTGSSESQSRDPLTKIILKCSHCDFETKSYSALNEHALSHKNTRAKKVYKCEVCGYVVKKKSGISRHVVTHSTLRELSKSNGVFRCEVCSYSTKRKDTLVQHVRKHKTRVKEREGKCKKICK